VTFAILCFDNITDFIVDCVFSKVDAVDMFDYLSPTIIAIVNILGRIFIGIDRFPNGTIVVVFGFGIDSKVIDRMS
jgi:hypothetical protein